MFHKFKFYAKLCGQLYHIQPRFAIYPAINIIYFAKKRDILKLEYCVHLGKGFKTMRADLFLKGETAKHLYDAVRDLPIVDYHCHLQPKEILENEVFTDIAQIWLGGDHYKWRLMRACGVPEDYVTGNASPREKFRAYAACLETAVGNPLYVWSHMELAMYFGIEDALTAENADEIFDRANAYIAETGMSPRKLMLDSRVELVATTDDPADTLEYHKQIAADETFPVRVVPSFRTDAALNICAANYADYIARLSAACGYAIDSLDDLKKALSDRLDFFCANGCRVSDVGIADFPQKTDGICACETFRKVRAGEAVSRAEYLDFLFEMYVFLAGEYKKHNITMQLHLNVCRNARTSLFTQVGPDAGGDCVGDRIAQAAIQQLLDTMDAQGGLPRTLLYTLEPSMYMPLATTAGSFRGVTLGAAWWYLDHKRGMEEQMDIFAETGSIAEFTGMLTDSRSFLSYARHDYFRRVLCSWVAERLDDGSLMLESAAMKILNRVCVENSRKLFA